MHKNKINSSMSKDKSVIVYIAEILIIILIIIRLKLEREHFQMLKFQTKFILINRIITLIMI